MSLDAWLWKGFKNKVADFSFLLCFHSNDIFFKKKIQFKWEKIKTMKKYFPWIKNEYQNGYIHQYKDNTNWCMEIRLAEVADGIINS